MTHRDGLFNEGAMRAYARVRGLSWKMRHGASCVMPHAPTTERFPRVFLVPTPTVPGLL